MRYDAPDGYGRYGILDTDTGGLLLCHECGQWRAHLATHVRLAHHTTADDYRESHGLGATTRLVGTAVRARLRETYALHRDQHLAALEHTRRPAEATAVSASRITWRPEVRAKRQAAGRARRSRDLTEAEIEILGDDIDLQAWADRARRLLTSDITAASIARAADISPATVAQRLRRYPAR